MKQAIGWIAVAVVAYLACGLYVVRGNEQALVRRFGHARLPMAASGLHYDLPWPFTQIDRVNVNEERTLAIGAAGGEAVSGGGFLTEIAIDRQAEFLTGDKNILNLNLVVQYRVADPYRYLCSGRSPEVGLKLLVESIATDVISRCGVDYVHPLGLNELRSLLTREAQAAVESQAWGLTVDDVTISGVFPPVEVKAAFLDVSNARAERERGINEELARSEKTQAAAEAKAQQTRDRAESGKNARVETARGAADRFTSVVSGFAREATSSGTSVEEVRRRAMQRAFASTIEELLPKLAVKVLLGTEGATDLTIFPAETQRSTGKERPDD